MSFAWFWMVLLLPLYWLVPQKNKEGHFLEHAFLMNVAQSQVKQRSTIKLTANTLAWCALVCALMRPQWLGPPLEQENQGRAIYFSVDISNSMAEMDMTWEGKAASRFMAVQSVLKSFVENRQGDFMGLVVFGAFADIQAPLTPDGSMLSAILTDLRPGFAGDGTAIGDGLALAAKQLRESKSNDKVIILLSDGVSNQGQVSPQEAMGIAQSEGIKVYTIGFGSDRMPVNQYRSNPIDETTLRYIAEQTQGQYFRALNSEQLTYIFELIEDLEPAEQYQKIQRLTDELFWYPLSVFLLCTFYSIGRSTIKRRRDRAI